MTKSKKKLVIIVIAAIVLVAIIYFSFTKKGKEQLHGVATKVGAKSKTVGEAWKATKVGAKSKTVGEAWKASKEEQFSKEVFFEGEKVFAELKSINGKDYALMPDDSVLMWTESVPSNGIAGPMWQKVKSIS